MKKFFFILALQIPLLAMAGVVVVKSGNNVVNVSNIKVGDLYVTYTVGDKEHSLPLEEVTAVLYDDGRYETVVVKAGQQSNNVVNNVANNTIGSVPKTPASTLNNNTANSLKSEFEKDKKIFKIQYSEEAKIGEKAVAKINKSFFSKGLVAGLTYNFKKSKCLAADEATIKNAAMNKYYTAKANGASGEDAIRAYYSFYMDAASGNNGIDIQSTQTINSQPEPVNSSGDNW